MRVFVLDDHTLIRQSVGLICDAEDDLELVGGASTVREALEKVPEVRPDVVIVDLHLPGTSGVEFVRQALDRWPELPLIAYTGMEGGRMADDAREAGVTAFLSKGADPTLLLETIRRVGRSRASRRSVVAEGRRVDELSPREREILTLMARGSNNREIAEALGISPRTVGAHVASIYRKLQVSDRVGATRRARSLGLWPSPEG